MKVYLHDSNIIPQAFTEEARNVATLNIYFISIGGCFVVCRKQKKIFLISYFLLEFSLCYKRLDHGGDTVDMPLSKILFKNPHP